MKAIKISTIIAIVIFIVMALTNPSYSSFKEYSSEFTTTKRKSVIKREKNYLIFSIYEKQVVSITGYNEYQYLPKERYIGILMNFYPIKEEIKVAINNPRPQNDISEIADTVTVDDSAYYPSESKNTDFKKAYDQSVGKKDTSSGISFKEAYERSVKNKH